MKNKLIDLDKIKKIVLVGNEGRNVGNILWIINRIE
jgi:hypothetical protein